MLAWYSLARVQQASQKSDEAIISFMEAESLAKQQEDYHYLALIEMNIADLYGRQNDTQEILRHDLLSAEYFEKAGEPDNAIFPRYTVALAYNELGNRHLCDSLLSSIERYALAKENGYVYGLVLGAKGAITTLNPNANPSHAISYLRAAVQYAPGDYNSSQCAQYFMIAFNLLEEPDSVDKYYNIALQKAYTSRDTISLYGTLQLIAKHDGDYKAANDYLEKAIKIQNRTMQFRESMIIANSIANYEKEKTDQAKKLAQERKWILITVLCCLFLLALLFIQRQHVHELRTREKDRIIAEKEQRIQEDLARSQEMMQSLEQLQKANDEVLKELGQSLVQQMSLVSQWAKAYYDVSEKDEDPHMYYQENTKTKKDIIAHFCASLEQIRNDRQWFERLETQVNLHKNLIMTLARKNAPASRNKKQAWTEDDYRTLTLMYAGLPDKAIAFLLNISEGGIRMRRLRYKAFFNQLNTDVGSYLARQLEKR